MRKILFFILVFISCTASFNNSYGQTEINENIDSLLVEAELQKDWHSAAILWKQAFFVNKYPTMLVRSAVCYAQLRDTVNVYHLLDTAFLCGYTNIYTLDSDTAFSFLKNQNHWKKFRNNTQIKYNAKTEVFYWGFYYGILALLLLLNLFLFFTNRTYSYLFLSLMLLGDMQWEMTMNSSLKIYFVDVLPWMGAAIAKQIPPVTFLLILQISYFFFANAFLKLKDTLPKAHKVFKWIIVLNLAILVPICFRFQIFPDWFNSLLLGISFVFFLIVGIIIWQRGHSGGSFFVIASIVFTAAIFFGVFLYRLPVFFVYSYLNIGLVLFFLILTIGVTDKMRVLRLEKQKVQEQALIFLEVKVKERTEEIVKQKDEIAAQKYLVEEKQKEIIDSISYAKRLQQAILPAQHFIDQEIPHNFVLYQPKDIVAGDFYWAEKVDDLFYIAAADSTGHGVPGALVSVVCSNALNRALKEFDLVSTGEILDKTRELVIETFAKSNAEVKDGMDISLLCIDQKNKKVYWSGANNPLWYVQNNELKEIKGDKQPIGKTEYPKSFLTHEIVYQSPSSFYLFTDGLADQFGGPKGKKFKYKQFSELLQANNNLTPINQLNNIEKVILDWKGDNEQVDDICVIGIRI